MNRQFGGTQYVRYCSDDLYNSMEKVLGPERKGRVINENERKIIAYHEAGHALVAASLKDSDPVHKISIISRGHRRIYIKASNGRTSLHNKSQFVAEIAVALGGFVAEKMFWRMSTGASSD